MKFIDKIANRLGYVKKQQARAFAAAQIGRLTSTWTQTITSVDQEVYRDLRKLRARARDLADNNDYMKNFLRLCRINVVGDQGIVLRNMAKDPSGKLDKLANKTIEDAWDKWGKKGSCDVTGKLSWIDLQQLVIEAVARDGEVLIRKVKNWDKNSFGFALQVLEIDYLDEYYNEMQSNGNSVRMGVEEDQWGRPVAYWLWTKHPGDYWPQTTGLRRERIPADDIIHIFQTIRPKQTRGIPWAHAAMIRLNMLGGYEEAELVAARLGASKMGFFERAEDGQSYEGDSQDAEGNLITHAEPGTFEALPNGVKLAEWNPNHPNGNFGTFVKSILRGIASGVGTNYNSLANDLEGVNLSSLRHGMLIERDFWKIIQKWLAESLHDQIFGEWLQWGMLKGEIKLPFAKFDKFNNPGWRPRRWPWIDPVKDAESNLLNIQMGAKDISDIIIEQGEDPDDVFDRIQKTRETLKSKGLGDIIAFIFEKKDKADGNGKNQED